MYVYGLKRSSRKVAGFQHESLLSSFSEIRHFHLRFRGFQSNYEATNNVSNHFQYFSINLNRRDLGIRTKIFEQFFF